MFETVLVILLCILMVWGIGDLFFDALGIGLKIFLGVVLLIAGMYLTIKMFIVLVPWILIAGLIGLTLGVVMLIKVLKRVI